MRKNPRERVKGKVKDEEKPKEKTKSCKFCDHIAVFAQDTIREYGTHEELLELEGGIYAEMFRTQARHYVDGAG